MPEISVKPVPGKLTRHRRAVLIALIFAIVAGVSLLALRHLGQWIQIDEPLRHSSAIAVLGGGIPFRPMEAANLYHEGWADQVWLTRTTPNDSNRAMEKLGIHQPTDDEYSRMVLEKLGVPSPAIHVIPEKVDNTATEVQAILRYAKTALPVERAGNPLILVTSKYHTRRVRVIWNVLTPGGQPIIVRYAPLEAYDALAWWRTTTDALATFRELFGILNARAGFPIAPREN